MALFLWLVKSPRCFATGFQKRQGNEGHDIPVLVSGGLVMVGPQRAVDGGTDGED